MLHCLTLLFSSSHGKFGLFQHFHKKTKFMKSHEIMLKAEKGAKVSWTWQFQTKSDMALHCSLRKTSLFRFRGFLTCRWKWPWKWHWWGQELSSTLNHSYFGLDTSTRPRATRVEPKLKSNLFRRPQTRAFLSTKQGTFLSKTQPNLSCRMTELTSFFHFFLLTRWL